ncbi:hypothetical protein MADP07_00259 [Mycoplasma anatis]|uniref:Uncharacterized protein n=1 Tax=Mycoplasmopsis anatis TaxID=171279 RepID=A0A9Q3QFG3_9BACT|nr:hypothetical protein [Mycoplasmopsis anatis]MBW0595959.1 hypothetical protein [Mycoplasmopsis anatis]MBW0597389.1 hypothetical protein [Mycoplasmopsis anatis]MBW0599404.1 hypothetical protein [Mycoplasmopsis anatis]MBW0600242.1 hypothetical protein [Mycoplasmopsis anatis]MBW0602537.1 hypothetical protein [Mycoplasmopsis anatis]
MKKFLLLKIIISQNKYWIIATILGLSVVLGICSSTIAYIDKLPTKSWENTIELQYSSYDRYAEWIFLSFNRGTLKFITENFVSLGYFSIINIIFIIRYHFKLKNIYQIKRLNHLTKPNKVKFIPLIVSTILFVFTILSFLFYDLYFINNLIYKKQEYLRLRIDKLWKNEIIDLTNWILHYIFTIGICYFIIDLSKYKISKFISLKLIFIVLSIILIIPFVINIINESLITSEGNSLNKILDLHRFILNPFDEWYLFYIGSAKEYVRNFSFENIEQIYQVLRIIYSLVALSYIIYHFVANRGKYE